MLNVTEETSACTGLNIEHGGKDPCLRPSLCNILRPDNMESLN